jgi:hypothetical protein
MFDRYTKAVLTVIAVALVWLCLRGPVPTAQAAAAKVTAPAVIRAQHFELADAQGRAVGDFGLSPGGAPRLVLRDRQGQGRVFLMVEPNGSSRLYLADENGKARADLRLLGDGSPSMALLDKDGGTRAGLRLIDDGSPRFSLSGKNGKGGVLLGSTAGDATSGLVMLDGVGKARALLGLKADGSPSLSLNGGPASLSLNDNSTGSCARLDLMADSTPVLTMANRSAGGSWTMVDENGRPFWETPSP